MSDDKPQILEMLRVACFDLEVRVYAPNILIDIKNYNNPYGVSSR
ncbi:hypothetical protein [Nostoc sp. TCL240-02]|nr:hypothetical protein [Nostoc sp. TCL240-02]